MESGNVRGSYSDGYVLQSVDETVINVIRDHVIVPPIMQEMLEILVDIQQQNGNEKWRV